MKKNKFNKDFDNLMCKFDDMLNDFSAINSAISKTTSDASQSPLTETLVAMAKSYVNDPDADPEIRKESSRYLHNHMDYIEFEEGGDINE